MLKINLFVDKYAGIGRRRLESMIKKEGAAVSADDYDLTIIVGGDGAFLENALRFAGKPVLYVKKKAGNGISLGRLSSESIDDIYGAISKLIEGRYSIKKEPILAARYMGRSYRSVGDFFIERGHVGHAIRYRYSISNGRMIRGFAISNGIIAATPIGSTGYYSYMDRLLGKTPKRIRGLGIAHILPAYVKEGVGGIDERGKIRRSVSINSIISVVFLRDSAQYLYGIPGMRGGVKVLPGKRIAIMADKKRLEMVELGR